MSNTEARKLRDRALRRYMLQWAVGRGVGALSAEALVRRLVQEGLTPDAAAIELAGIITDPVWTISLQKAGGIVIHRHMYKGSVVTPETLRTVIQTLRKTPWLSAASVASKSGTWITRAKSCIELLREFKEVDTRVVGPSRTKVFALIIGGLCAPN